MIKLYIYNKTSGLIVREDFGVINHVIRDINGDLDFTLTPPPDYDHVWRWIDDKWIADTAE